jgi:hypothetical protein
MSLLTQGPRTFPLDPRAHAGQNFEILTRKPRPQPDKNEGLEPGYLGQVSGQKCSGEVDLEIIMKASLVQLDCP